MENLQDKAYNSDDVNYWTKTISDEIKTKLKGENSLLPCIALKYACPKCLENVT